MGVPHHGGLFQFWLASTAGDEALDASHGQGGWQGGDALLCEIAARVMMGA